MKRLKGMVRDNPHYGVFLLGLAMSSLSQGARAEDSLLQQQVNAALSLMTFTVTPDITASNLSINNGNGDTSDLLLTQVGGGATMSNDVPVYLEGNLGFSRYDPQFVISRGEESNTIPGKWNTVSVSGGIGWDFDLSEHWVIRPIANLSLGTVASDLRIADWLLDHKTAKETAFLENGRLNAYGLGGSLMLDYELFSERHDIDAEIRYSYIHLQSFGSTSEVVQGAADAENLSIYLRRRAPTGLEFLSRPVRYVLEGARTEYFGTQRGLLGFNALNSLGAGLEIDSSQYDIIISRTRLVGRYMFGENTAGYSMGLAVSF